MKIGLALVDVPRFRRLREKYGDRLLNRLFTQAERLYAFRHRDPDPHLAGRLAAKLAFKKTFEGNIRFSQLEILRDQGAPEVRGPLVSGNVQLSITHTQELAIAQVIVEEA